MEKEFDPALRIGRAEGRVLTLYEAASRLKTSYNTVYRLVCDGELPAFRLRSSWRTSDVACDEYVNKLMREQVELKKQQDQKHKEQNPSSKVL